jgi:hypothetical protein
MTDRVALRQFVYDRILADGTPPASTAIAERFGTTRDAALRALADLKIGKTILVHPVTGEIWMAGPFSAVPTQYVVERAGLKTCAN